MRTVRYLLIVLFFGCFGAFQCVHSQQIETFSLNDVRLTSGPFKDAQETDLQYIMEMDVDKLLAPYLVDAGIEPVKPTYGNWEGGGLNGHIGGHYLSALSMMYASTGNEAVKERLDYMLKWLDSCQQKNGNGYIGGIPDGKRIWKEISAGNIRPDFFSLNGGWVPLYNIHKVFAGLRDAYWFTGSSLARDMWIGLSDWWLEMTKNLSDEQFQQMLKSEHGGLNEVFADIYQETGEEKYMEMARKLSHHLLLDPLIDGEDKLTGMHANTQIPKVVGFQRIANLTNDSTWRKASDFFWETVVTNRTIAIGGNSVREHFHNANDFSPMVRSEQGPETCNTYNMLRLSKLLYEDSGDTRYLDFYERGLYNHILSSQHPGGGFVYFTPVRPQHYRVYSKPHEGMWCCVGSGLENHTKYGELIYSYSGDDFFVNLFISSELMWKEKGIHVTQTTNYPEEDFTTLKLQLERPSKFVVNIRKPDWLAGEPVLKVNGKVKDIVVNEGYFMLKRKWKTGDEIRIELPMTTRLEFLPDSSSWAAYMHGPVVMASVVGSQDLEGLFADDSRMGHVAQGKFYPIKDAPVLVGDANKLTSNLEEIAPLEFDLSGKFYSHESEGIELSLIPFYKVHEARYMMYWPVTDSAKLLDRIEKLEKEERAQAQLRAITIDAVQPGQQQPEADHLFKGEGTYGGYSNERYWRSGHGWFSYSLKDAGRKAKFLRIGYQPSDKHQFEILINDTSVGQIKIPDEIKSDSDIEIAGDSDGEYYAFIPLEKLDIDDRFRITIQSKQKTSLPRIFDVRAITKKIFSD